MLSELNHPSSDRLEAFAEGVLEAADRAVVESHLLGCTQCQTAVEEWRVLFAALAGLPQFEPAAGFGNRVMAHVRVAPAVARQWHLGLAGAGLRKQAARAGAALEKVLPRTTFGWAVAAGFLALPFVVGAVVIGWLMTRSYITPAALWAFLSTEALEGARALGTMAVSAALQTEVAGWLAAQAGAFLARAGITGVGVLAAAAGVTTVLSVWVLYRNLIRTPTRESHYASYSF